MHIQLQFQSKITIGLFTIIMWVIVAMTGAASNIAVPPGFQLVVENQYLQLYANYATCEIAVVDQVGDRVWLSNPDDQRAQEQLSIEYFSPRDDFRRMNSHNDSVAYDQFTITEIDNGIRVEYMLGLAWEAPDYLPTFISEQRFNELILSHIKDENDKEFVRTKYTKISLEETPADYERISISNVDKEALFGFYTMAIETEPSGRARGDFIRHVLDQYRLERADITSVSQVTPAMIEPLIETPTMVISPSLWPWDIESMIDIIKSSGYNPVDKQHDNESYNIDPPEAPVEIFTIPVEYRLDGNSLVVRIPMQDVKYPQDVYTSQTWGFRGVHWLVVEDTHLMEAFGRIGGSTVTFPLHAINLLRFFGTPQPQQTGYILIPDGSGALINLMANRTRQTNDMNLQHSIYGRDLSNIGGPADVDLEQELQRYFQRQQLPVFGMNQGDTGFLAIIEEGDAIASIIVETAGTINPTDTVYPRFQVIPVGTVQLVESARGGGGAYINTYQDRLPECDIQVRYLFLSGDDTSYSGMAQRYQQYIIDKYSLEKTAVQDQIPFYLELIGGIHKQQPVMGVPRQVIEPVTTYDQVRLVVDQIQDTGIENIVLRYSGWFEGGIDHVYPSKVFLEPALGSRKNFLDLKNYLADHNVDFYPDLTVTYVAKSKLNDGFKPSTHAAYSLNKHLVGRRLPSGTNSYVLSMRELDSLLERFLTDYDDFGISGLSLGDLGTNLNSDFHKEVTELIDRQQAKDIISDTIAKIANKKSLILEGANIYAAVYADHILNMPVNNSGFIITDRQVPFYQMVTRGYVNYAGVPINHSIDLQDSLLKMLEIGAYPYFLLGAEESAVVKDTPFHYLLSTDYRTWLVTAAEIYHEVNDVLGPLQGQAIISHQQLDTDVFETTYEQGTRIIVNYRREPVSVEGHILEAQSYLTLRGEDNEN